VKSQFSKTHTAHGLVISESTIHQTSSPNLTTRSHTYTDLFDHNQLSLVFFSDRSDQIQKVFSCPFFFLLAPFDTTDRIRSDSEHNSRQAFRRYIHAIQSHLWRRLTLLLFGLYLLSLFLANLGSILCLYLKKRYQASSGFF
jgi:hypothetical protein